MPDTTDPTDGPDLEWYVVGERKVWVGEPHVDYVAYPSAGGDYATLSPSPTPSSEDNP